MTLTIKEAAEAINAKIEGRLDTASSTQFSKDMQPLLDNAGKHIILDCAGLEFISSSGLRLLLSLRKASIAANGKVTITNVQEAVKQVFVLTGFYSLFDFA